MGTDGGSIDAGRTGDGSVDAGSIDAGSIDAGRVALARRDPAAGWTEIWDAHGADLHRYCTRLLDTPVDADDVVAEVFLVAAERLDQLREPAALRGWLFAIARRSVQQRWRRRDRTTPIDPHGGDLEREPSTVPTGDDVIGAAEAEELVAAAAGGLSIRDRELLALTLGADLDTVEVARVTGMARNAVSVRVTRLKETIGRAAGALLVARHHRRDCDELDRLLQTWDGTFDPVWRKRIARHVDGCDECATHRGRAVAAFAAPLPFLAPPPALRDRVLTSIRSTAAAGNAYAGASADGIDGGGAQFGSDEFSDAGGFPPPRPWPSEGRRRPIAALGVALAALLLGFGLVSVPNWFTTDGDTELVVDASARATEAAPAGPSTVVVTTPTTATTDPPPTVTAPPATPTTEPAPPTTLGLPDPPPESTPTTDPPPEGPPPSVVLRVSPTVVTSCDNQAQATVSVRPGAGDVSTEVAWDGGAPGSRTIPGVGVATVEIGPFAALTSSVIETITVTATSTDAAGQQAVETATLQFENLSC